MNQNAEAEEYDDVRPSNGLFARLRERLMGHDEYEEEEEEMTDATPVQSATPRLNTAVGVARRSSTSLRIEHARRVHVTVRRAVQSFDDARRAADGLKEGQQQIVNLEQTPADMTERIIDFLNGATYALDGSVEKIGDQVYLFTPCSVTIDIEDRPVAANTRPSFLDRS